MDPRRLTLLRHGQAQSPDSCPEDFERTLTRRGIVEARDMARRIVQRGMIPDLILVSPAERAWATASLVATACELDAKQLRCARELYLAEPMTLWRLVRSIDDSVTHVLICGHNPGLSQIAGRFGPKPEQRDLPTAGMATALWSHAVWATLEPETADDNGLDDPDNMADLWA